VTPLQQMLVSRRLRPAATPPRRWVGSGRRRDGGTGAGAGGFRPGRAGTDGLGSGELAAPQARAALERAEARDSSLAVRQAAGQALPQIAEQPAVRTSLLADWALALSRWQGVLWLIVALSLFAAAWLWMVDRRRSPAPAA